MESTTSIVKTFIYTEKEILEILAKKGSITFVYWDSFDKKLKIEIRGAA